MLQSIFDELRVIIAQKLLEAAEWAIGISTSAADGIWDHPVIVMFLGFIRWLNVGVLGAATILLIFDIIEETGKQRTIEWSMIIINFMKAFAFAIIAPYAGKYALLFSARLAGTLQLSTAASQLRNAVPSLSFFIIVVVLAACIIFAFMSLSRFGAMFVQVLSSVLYVSDIVRGESASMGSWLRQTVAIALTYLIQTILFYLGVFFLVKDQLFFALAFWFAMPQVKTILQKYGMSCGVTGVVSSAATVASAGLQLVSKT